MTGTPLVEKPVALAAYPKTVGYGQQLRGDMAALTGMSFGDLMGKLGEVQRTGGDIGGEFRAWDPLISGVQGQITGAGGLGAEVDRIVKALDLMKGSFGEGGLDQLAGQTLADLETSRGLLDPETGALMAGAEGLSWGRIHLRVPEGVLRP